MPNFRKIYRADTEFRFFFRFTHREIPVFGAHPGGVQKLKGVLLKDWIEHLYYIGGNRVSKHPTLKFHLLNLLNKQRALDQGNFCVANFMPGKKFFGGVKLFGTEKKIFFWRGKN